LRLALRGRPSEDPLVRITLVRAHLARNLGIQPSEVDAMTDEEIAGYIAYIDEMAKIEKEQLERKS